MKEEVNLIIFKFKDSGDDDKNKSSRGLRQLSLKVKEIVCK